MVDILLNNMYLLSSYLEVLCSFLFDNDALLQLLCCVHLPWFLCLLKIKQLFNIFFNAQHTKWHVMEFAIRSCQYIFTFSKAISLILYCSVAPPGMLYSGFPAFPKPYLWTNKKKKEIEKVVWKINTVINVQFSSQFRNTTGKFYSLKSYNLSMWQLKTF